MSLELTENEVHSGHCLSHNNILLSIVSNNMGEIRSAAMLSSNGAVGD